MEAADFSGYATKAGLKCSDGRTIMPEAFKHQDKVTVPLVWQHGHNNPENVLGHAVLENRDSTHPDGAGVYAYGFFNGTPQGANSKALVQHKDINYLSIFANQLIEKNKQVFHGIIREVSLVLAGANPGAKIDFVAIQHGEGGEIEVLEDEAVITTGLELEHADGPSEDGPTIEEVYNTLSDEQKEVVHYMIGAAVEGADDSASHSDDSSDDNQSDDESDDTSAEDDLTHKEGNDVTNVFEKGAAGESVGGAQTLTHDDMRGIFADAAKKGSLKEALEGYVLSHGIDNLEILFPDARTLDAEPEWIKRRTEWVAGVLNGVRKTPFSRIKTRSADITHEEARAKGYIKGNLKKEEFFSVSQRVTTPTTIYKKQKLDRDDILDITDFDVVMWMKGEMRLMWEEELARAILIGDGREVDDEDKVRDPMGAPEGAGIRSIANDHELYVTTVNINFANETTPDWNELVESVMRARTFYKGSGSPTFYTTVGTEVEMLLSKDSFGRRRFNSRSELEAALGVAAIVNVEVLENQGDLLGIIVNLADYAVGADRGGEMTFFDDFDLDYNQYKYLYEGRCSGALTKIKSAMVLRRSTAASGAVTPNQPAFDESTGALTITDQTGVVYKHGATTLNAAGSPYSVPAGTTWTVNATPASGYNFPTSENDSWDFEADA